MTPRGVKTPDKYGRLFTSATERGRPVDMRITITVNFRP